MSATTEISWTDATWSPITGCTRVSPGCDHCLDPRSRVLLRDGSWKRLADVRVGDELLSCSERPRAGGNRLLEVASVEAIAHTAQPTMTVTTGSGRQITCSPDHRFLTGVGRPEWRRASSLRLGSTLYLMGDPDAGVDTTDPTYRAGYIAGVTDGDGTLRWDPTWRPGLEPGHQVYWRVAMLADDRAVLDRLVSYLLTFGVAVEVKQHSTAEDRRPMLRVETRVGANLKTIADLVKPHGMGPWKAGWLAGFLDTDGWNDGKSHRWSQMKPNGLLDRTVQYVGDLGFRAGVESSGTTVRLEIEDLDERVRFIGAIRPALARKTLDQQIGTRYSRRPDQVVALEAGRPAELIDITTSTGTFIAEGITTHNCYIERTPPLRMAGRRFDRPGMGGTTGVQLHPERMRTPMRWRKPRRVFVCSMADAFHDDVPDQYLALMFAVMAASPRHTFQVLTKRPARMRALLSSVRFQEDVIEEAFSSLDLTSDGNAYVQRRDWPLSNVWLGVTVEDQKRADLRVPTLLNTPAAVRFLSCEPLLGPVDLFGKVDQYGGRPHLTYWLGGGPAWGDPETHPNGMVGRPLVHKPGVDWVIAGGESGPGARPMHPDWARELRDQCAAAGVAFHFKQHGEWTWSARPSDPWCHRPPDAWMNETGQVAKDCDAELTSGDWLGMHRVGKKAAGRELDGRTHDDFPATPPERHP